MLNKADQDFRHPKVAHIDYKLLQMDRVLTGFLQRLYHRGYPSKLSKPASFELKTDAFVDEFLKHPDLFVGFGDNRNVAERWIETHLMDIVNRGIPDKQAIAAPRPLHGFTYRFRNTKHSRDYGAAEQLYETLWGARSGVGERALGHLRDFFFQGIDQMTGQVDNAVLDVETQALLHLKTKVNIGDIPDDTKERNNFTPLCVGSADLMAEDVMRLLFFGNYIPRTVMVEYLKILLSFHLALYFLRLFKLLPALVRRQGGDPVCAKCPVNPKSFSDPQGGCPYRIGLVLDVEGRAGTPMARLAELSADAHYRRIPDFVKANYMAKKLDEYAAVLISQKKLAGKIRELSVGRVLELLQPAYEAGRELFFEQRMQRILDASKSAGQELDAEEISIQEMGLPSFDTYIELLVAKRGSYHRSFIVKCLDSLLMKNDAGALLAQARNKPQAPRRFVLDSRLLEVLLQIAVLHPGGALGYHTREIRVEELLTFLRERYGLYIDRLPPGDGFAGASIEDRQALRDNLQAFHKRLREVGYMQDLSDAYITQTVVPRYRIDLDGTGSLSSNGDRP